MLPTDKVLVTIGTPCSMSAVGSTETFLARVTESSEFIGFAAFDAGLIEFTDERKSAGLQMRWLAGERAGKAATLTEIEATVGAQLRAKLGIRSIRDHVPAATELVTDIAAPLPHDLEEGGLRGLAGLTFRDVRDSAFDVDIASFERERRVRLDPGRGLDDGLLRVQGNDLHQAADSDDERDQGAHQSDFLLYDFVTHAGTITATSAGLDSRTVRITL